MPIYEYHCNACEVDFEKLVFGSPSEILCEKCGSNRTEKLMSRFGMGRADSGGPSPGPSKSGSGCGGCSSSNCSSC